MRLQNDQGYILVTVLLLVLILAVLGAAFVVATNFEGQSSFLHSDKIQAYYLARSGAETAFQYVIDNWANEKPEHSTIYFFGALINKGLETSYNSIEQNKNNPIYVTMTYHEDDSDWIEIKSIGKYGSNKVTEEVNLVLEFAPSNGLNQNLKAIDDEIIAGLPIEKAVAAGDAPNMLSGNHGVIANSDRFFAGAVKFSAAGNSSNNLRTTPHDNPYFTADAFYFEADSANNKLEISERSVLTLEADKFIFYREINIGTHNNHDDGRLCLKSKDELSIVHFEYDLTYKGAVLVTAGTYQFEGKLCFPAQNDNQNNTNDIILEWH